MEGYRDTYLGSILEVQWIQQEICQQFANDLNLYMEQGYFTANIFGSIAGYCWHWSMGIRSATPVTLPGLVRSLQSWISFADKKATEFRSTTTPNVFFPLKPHQKTFGTLDSLKRNPKCSLNLSNDEQKCQAARKSVPWGPPKTKSHKNNLGCGRATAWL